jgi:glycine/D-amino acid oxidase-like deaminating enzyme
LPNSFLTTAHKPMSSGVSAARNGDVSFWWQQIGLPAQRASLPGDHDADVCIVGAGYTGLWTAYYLKKLDPSLRIVILEARFAGYGASGRNAGWVVGDVTGGRARYAKSHGRQSAIDHQLALNATVDEVLAVMAAEGIDADARKGGELTVARTASQLARLREHAESEKNWPGTDLVVLGAEESAARIRVDGVRGSIWNPHCAKVNPAKLVKGLAAAVEKLGVTIYENTTVDEITAGAARTATGTVRAPHVIRATEGFTANLTNEHRTWLPMNSSMIVTHPLPESVWAQIGWDEYETLGDYSHVYMYAQRTADGRIAIGGRGVPYRFGSRVDTDGVTPESTISSLAKVLTTFFPSTIDAPIDHAWSGVLGVPRDWAATVGLDKRSGLGWAGGYVGTGVAATNLAGRTLADLILDRDTDLVRLPWVGHVARRWEFEPLRWLAVHGIYAAYGAADRAEARGGEGTALPAKLADLIAGR